MVGISGVWQRGIALAAANKIAKSKRCKTADPRHAGTLGTVGEVQWRTVFHAEAALQPLGR